MNFDDGFFWLDIIAKKPILNGVGLAGGRFFPLGSMDLNLLMLLGDSPYIFFGFNALVLFGIGAMLWNLLGFYPINSTIKLAIAVISLLNPAFLTIILGICYPEKILALFLLIFLNVSVRLQRGTSHSLALAVLGIISANVAIYLKEPVFIMLGIITLGGLISAVREKKRGLKCYYLLILLSAVVFAGIYVLVVIPNVQSFYGSPMLNTFGERLWRGLVSVRGVSLIHPWIIALLPIFLALMVWEFVRFRRFSGDEVWLFSLLVAGFVYFLAFVKLELMRGYYFTPIYFVCAVSVGVYVGRYWGRVIVRFAAYFCVGIYLFNALPQALWTYSFLKSQGVALHQSLAFLQDYTKDKEKVNIYFYGIGREITAQEYLLWHFGLYLREIYGVKNADILTNVPNKTPLNWRFVEDSAMSVMNSTRVDSPQKGDLVIVNANTLRSVEIPPHYALLHKSSVVGLPHISLKTLLKYALSYKYSEDSNPFRLPINNYIYRVE